MNGILWLVLFGAVSAVALAAFWRTHARKKRLSAQRAAHKALLKEERAQNKEAESAVSPEAERNPQNPSPSFPESKETAGPVFDPSTLRPLPQLTAVPAPVGVRSDAVLLWAVFLARLYALAATCRLRLEALEDRAGGDADILMAHKQMQVVNDRTAHLEESYQEELDCHGEILAFLDQLAAARPETAAATVRASLLHRAARTEAENFLEAWTRDTQNPPQQVAKAAFFSARLAELRADLSLALARYAIALRLDPRNLEYLRPAGNLAHFLGHYEEAGAWRAALERRIRLQPGYNLAVLALAQRDLAFTCLKVGRLDKAGPLYKSAMIALSSALGNNHPEMATSWFQIGEMQESQGALERAYSLYQRSLKMLESSLGLLDQRLCPALDKLASLSLRFGRDKDALAYRRKIVAILERALPPDHPLLADNWSALAEAYTKCDEYAQAERCCLKSLKINRAIHGREHPIVEAQLSELSWLCAQQGRVEDANRYQDEAENLHLALIQEAGAIAETARN